jgi:hypothetical protein
MWKNTHNFFVLKAVYLKEPTAFIKRCYKFYFKTLHMIIPQFFFFRDHFGRLGSGIRIHNNAHHRTYPVLTCVPVHGSTGNL